jgi:hypothetical protein
MTFRIGKKRAAYGLLGTVVVVILVLVVLAWFFGGR